MSVLVTYASKYGATEEIAQRIAQILEGAGQIAETRRITEAGDPAGFDAIVLGSAVFNMHWMKSARGFVHRNQRVLSQRAVWLFSSGPLRTETEYASDPELKVAAEPKEIAHFRESLGPRDHRVFFGALDRGKLGFAHRAQTMLPAARPLFPEGDFRDWQEIQLWAEGIAEQLSQAGEGKE